ncbi:hypothetical protein K432DRAFT_391605 [Lepidopterella palustris CBS 459.81]|uniref:Uncharacterized protein n=1 Tax=Lepidopterella palustris CBS 459.81 TaxID=1314670 RepID=A0A8E2JGR6_9PEZI|nr:hypothetical protein K432DRAFT_391605 [Lepidopterella palustris CBS 459.81]
MDDFTTGRFPNSNTGHLSPSTVSILAHHAPEPLEEVLTLSAFSKPGSTHNADQLSPERRTRWRSNLNKCRMEIRSSPITGTTTPWSRKTSSATILTERSGNQPAFESDAFAVNMPTTREHIEPTHGEFRARLPSPSSAQVAAYQHYAERARRSASHEYHLEHIPARIVSYDHAYENMPSNTQYVLELDATPPSSLHLDSPRAFSTSLSACPVEPYYYTSNPRSVSSSSQHSITRKPFGESPSHQSNDAPYVRYRTVATSSREPASGHRRLYHDVECGAEHSPSISPKGKWKAKVRNKQKHHDRTQSQQQADKPPKESWWSLYTRSIPQPAPATAPQPTHLPFSSPKPTQSYAIKVAPSFWHTAPQFSTTSVTPPPNTARPHTKASAWLRPATTPSHPQNSSTSATTTGYIDPFAPSPPPLHPHTTTATSPRKLARSPGPRPPPSLSTHPSTVTPKFRAAAFEAEPAQVKRLATLILKICLVVYVAVGLYYILDAVRETIWIMMWPVRVTGTVWR